MIYSIKGQVIHKEVNMIVVECNNIGYKCMTSQYTISKLVSQEVMLYTYLHVREDALDLFGFADENELNCFKLLISVSGVGPKAAIAVLSEMSAEKFALCVASGDSKALTKAQGIGLKTAQRILLELKDKLKSSSDGTSELGTMNLGMGNVSEAINALVVLGYATSEAVAAVLGADNNMSVEEIIKLALKKIASKK